MAEDKRTGTIVVWGVEQTMTRYISVSGESTVEALLKAVTATSIDHLSFFDNNGIRFGDICLSTKIKQFGQYDADQKVWTVIVKPKQKAPAHPKVIQRQHVSTNEVIYGKENSITWGKATPQIDQGGLALSVVINPKSKDSTLRIHANLIGRRESEIAIAALFRSDDKNAMQCVCNNGPNGWFVPIIIDYEMKSNTTKELTLSVRITNYALNGRANKSAVFNGVMSSSMTVEEIV